MSHESFLSVFFITFLISGAYLRGGHGGMSPPHPYPEFWEKMLYFWDETANFGDKNADFSRQNRLFWDKNSNFSNKIIIVWDRTKHF